jgi:uncharacterized membrane protein (UPF0127 family)
MPLHLCIAGFENERGASILVSIEQSDSAQGNTQLAARHRILPQRYCVFNKTRESFLSLNVTAADTHFARLRGLLGRLRLKSDEGIWVVPSLGIHTLGVLFSVDLIYLDADHRVVHLVESLGSFRIGPIRPNCASVLELPTRTIYSSQTQIGDQLFISSQDQMEDHLRSIQIKQASKSVSW